jgi:FemAB-related protein (PEP-CTERM system-associated)
MQIVRCDESFGDRWNAFVDRANGSFYHRFEWRGVNRAEFGHDTCYLAAVEHGQIVGIFPLVVLTSRVFGRIGCSLPFVNYGGPVALSPAIEAALLAEAQAVADERRLDYLEIRAKTPVEGLVSSDHKVSMTVSLDPNPDVLWEAFKSGHRQDIRRGYKNGYAARTGGRELLDDVYTVLSESWRDLGTPFYRRSYFSRLFDTFGPALRTTVVYAGTEPAAVAIDGLHGDTVEGMWLGMRARHRARLAGYVLYWELIKRACEDRYRTFHLGRSTVQSGAESFKKKWNAQPTQLYWHYLLRGRREMPRLNVDNPKYRLAMNAWRKLPLPITQLVGPMIARSIP